MRSGLGSRARQNMDAALDFLLCAAPGCLRNARNLEDIHQGTLNTVSEGDEPSLDPSSWRHQGRRPAHKERFAYQLSKVCAASPALLHLRCRHSIAYCMTWHFRGDVQKTRWRPPCRSTAESLPQSRHHRADLRRSCASLSSRVPHSADLCVSDKTTNSFVTFSSTAKGQK